MKNVGGGRAGDYPESSVGRTAGLETAPFEELHGE